MSTYKVQAYENEPLEITLQSLPKSMMDLGHLEPERGFLNETGQVVFRPRGAHDSKTLYLTDYAHEEERNVTILVDTVPSHNAQLYDMRPSTGYLEPAFSKSHYSYFLRVPEGTTSSKFRLTAVDDVNTRCSYNRRDDARGTVVGKGVTSDVSLGSVNDPSVVVIECVHPNKPDSPVRYMLQTVQQRGGSTQLRSLDVNGADLQQTFDPLSRGVYTADLSTSKPPAGVKTTDPRWVSFKAVPENKKAKVSVEGFPVDENWNSPYFRIPIGETRLFHVGIQTPKNPVTETYTVAVSRPSDLGWGPKLLQLVTGATTMMSSTRAYHFLHNFHVLQWISAVSPVPGVAETWQPTSSVTDKFNWLFGAPKLVSFATPEGGAYDTNREAYLVDGMPVVSQETPYGHLVNRWALDALPAAFAFNRGQWSQTVADGLALQMDLERQSSDDSERHRRRSLTGLSDVDAIDNESFFDCRNGDDCGTPIHTLAGQYAAMRRRLAALDPLQRNELMRKLENSYNDSRAVLVNGRRLGTIFVSLAVIGVLYGSVYVGFKRSHRLQDLAQIYPRWLQPVRFWIFVLDLCGIAVTQSAFTLMFSPLQSTPIQVLGMQTTPRALGMAGMALFAFVVLGFVAVVAVELGQVRKTLVFANVFSRWHDFAIPTIKAFHSPLSWVPLVGRLTSVEIRDVAPIATFRTDVGKEKNQEGIVNIQLNEEPRQNAAWLEGNAREAFSKFGYGGMGSGYGSDERQMLVGDKPAIKYYNRTDDTGVFLDMIAFQDDQYPNRNAKAMHEFPEAYVSSCKRVVYNHYGNPVECHAQVQLKHLPAIADKFEVSLLSQTVAPREHLDMPSNDTFSNVIAKAQRGNLFWWVFERVGVLSAVAFAAAVNDPSGRKQLWAFGIAASLLLLVAIPSVFGTSLSDYWYQMQCDMAAARKACRYEAETQNKFRIWPYRSKAARQHYLQISEQIERDAQKYVGYRVWNTAISVYYDVSENPIWRSRAVAFVRNFATHQAMTETMKICVCFALMLGSASLGIFQDKTSTSWAVLFCCIALLMVNWESIRMFLGECGVFAKELYYRSRSTWLFVKDLLSQPGELSNRLSFYVNKCFEALHANSSGVSFIFDGFQSECVHDMAVKDIVLVNNQIGTVMPGVVEKTQSNGRAIEDENNPLTTACYGLQKTLHMANGVGVYRPEMYRALPFEMPLSDMLSETDDELKRSRLMATMQIVNHNYIRYVPLLQHKNDDDSFLSFYTNPSLVPGAGDLRKQYLGPGLVVAYDPSYAILRVKGPGIVAGKVYNVKVTDKKPEFENVDQYTEPSEGFSSEHHGPDASSVAICATPGVLNVRVERHKSPNLSKPVRVLKGEIGFEIDPVLSHVVWDEANRVMVLFSEQFLVSEDPGDQFTVHWFVRPNAKTQRQMFEDIKAERNGELVVCLKAEDPVPYMNKSMYVRVRAQDKSICLDLDPCDTNAHEFPLSVVARLPRGPGNDAVSREVSVKSELDTWFGSQSLWEPAEDRVPCTIVMCVDPVAQDFRVEPDFYLAKKRTEARIIQLKALRTQALQKDLLWLVWPQVVSQSEYADFWRNRGVNVFEHGKRLVDPTFERAHPQIAAHKHAVYESYDYLVRMLLDKIDRLCAKLEQKRNLWREWQALYDYKAYTTDSDSVSKNDVTLYDLYHTWQESRLNNDPEEPLHFKGFCKMREHYGRSIPGFVYPMIVNRQFLSRTANWEAQFDEWQRQLEAWLEQEETAKNAPAARGGSQDDLALAREDTLSMPGYTAYYHPIIRQFLTSLRQNVFRAEKLKTGRTVTVLHYVTNSLAVRGPDYFWKPDPLGAMFACVRVWKSSEVPTSPADCRWLTCMVKLTGNSFKMMLCDPSFNPPNRKYDWNRVYGWRIPLDCFERIELGVDNTVAPDNVYTRTMTGQVVFRKNMDGRVDDSYVESIATGEISNSCMPIYGKQCWLIMNGYDVPKGEVPVGCALRETHAGDGPMASVYPLTVRLFPRDLERWQSVVRACGMNRKRADGRDKVYIDPRKASVPPVENDIPSSHRRDPPPFQPPTPLPENIEDGSRSDTRSNLVSDYTQTSPPEHTIHGNDTQSPVQKTVNYSGAFRNRYDDWRYAGHGHVTQRGDIVYEGGWRDGQRYGEDCRCLFRDPSGREWLYEGGFFADEFAGPGQLKANPGAEPLDTKPFTLKSFRGNFNLPKQKALGRGESLPQHDAPAVNLGHVRKLFEAASPRVLLIDDAGSTGSTVLVLDDAEGVSLGGDENALGQVPLGKLARDFNRPRANVNQQSSDEVSSQESLNDGAQGSRRYLPYQLGWTRKIDPNLGYQGLDERFGTGLAEYTDGCSFDKKDCAGLLHGKPNGGGVFKCPICPLTYTGFMKHGAPDGRGQLSFRFAEGRLGPWARSVVVDYKGEWKDGRRNGWGVCRALNGMVVARGEWKDDLLHGDQCSVEISGSLLNHPDVRFRSYYGACRDGRPEGYGELVFKKIKAVDWTEDVKKYVTYRGQFSKGVRDGSLGVMLNEKGEEIYRGAWDRDSAGGRVIKYRIPAGADYTGAEVYTGNVASGELSGYGKMYNEHTNQLIYEGMWANNVPEGQGIRSLPNGDRYVGAFLGGRPNGRGTLYFHDGRSYESNWLKGRPHGEGRYTDEDKHVHVLNYEGGEPVVPKKGACRGAPAEVMTVDFSDMNMGGHHYAYWRGACKVNPDWLLVVLQPTIGMWQYHVDHKGSQLTDLQDYVEQQDGKVAEQQPAAPQQLNAGAPPAQRPFMQKFCETAVEIDVKYAKGLPNNKLLGSAKATVYVLWGQRSLKTVSRKVHDGAAEWNDLKLFTEDTAFQNIGFAMFDEDSKGTPIGFGTFDIMGFLIESMDKPHAARAYDIPLVGTDGADAGVLSIRISAKERNPDDLKTRHEDAPIYYDQFPVTIVEALKEQANVDHLMVST
ncbi:putative MORN repeat protein [Gregarina niphandrodes]|uniref:MORN repeat protein n=1 Tax=Gregarina niphandrodes TaxID=110365 RepID=A0A023B9V0_GRENI|nr:putative MORN repeat protein [Gregarina niphandrodes]EZG76507.1 putative MORN repeat protein [Gregarina niphandrodes]|eukprot:XP_011129567.1 putative MORN repeat protein [Gregarina niphandrodes]